MGTPFDHSHTLPPTARIAERLGIAIPTPDSDRIGSTAATSVVKRPDTSVGSTRVPQSKP